MVFKQALQEAKARLQAVEVDFAALEAERDRLRAVVDSLEAFAGASEQRALTVGAGGADDEKNDIPLWSHARNVLSSHGSPLTPAQIAEQLQTSGVETANANSIRVAMFRKPDLFRSDGSGRYSLIEPVPEPKKVEVFLRDVSLDDYAQSAEISDDDIPF